VAKAVRQLENLEGQRIQVAIVAKWLEQLGG